MTRQAHVTTMEDVWHAYRGDLQAVETRIRQCLTSRVDLINKVTRHIITSGGKRLRPLLVVMASRLCGRAGRAGTLVATIVEFIHTASLLHDDVLDEAEERRGKRAVRMLWGNHASILAGDYLYSQAVSLTLNLKNHAVNETLSLVCKRMAEGEAVQLSWNGNLRVSEAEYVEMIQSKTATLIAASCRLGGLLTDATPHQLRALTRYGQHLGTAFQIADDTLDYTAAPRVLGKPRGKDFRSGEVTLPLLHLLKTCDRTERQRVRHLLTSNGAAKDGMRYVMELMHQYGSTMYALSRARQFSTLAKQNLAAFEDSPHRQALTVMADYVVTRDR